MQQLNGVHSMTWIAHKTRRATHLVGFTAAAATLFLALISILIAPLNAAAQPADTPQTEPIRTAATSYMGYTHVDPVSQVPTLHTNESSQGIAPSLDNLVYCFNSHRSWPPTGASDDVWHRKYNMPLSDFAAAKPTNQSVLNVMYSGFSSNPNRDANRVKLGLRNDAEFYAATQMAIWRLTDGEFSTNTAWESIFGAERVKAIRAAAVKLVSSSDAAPSEATLEIYEAQNVNYQNLLGIHFVRKDTGDKFHGSISGSVENLKGENGETSGTTETIEDRTPAPATNVIETTESTSTETISSSAPVENTETSKPTEITEAKTVVQTTETSKETVKVEDKQVIASTSKTPSVNRTETKTASKKEDKPSDKRQARETEEPKPSKESKTPAPSIKASTSKLTESASTQKTTEPKKAEKSPTSKAASSTLSKASTPATLNTTSAANANEAAPTKSSPQTSLAQTGATVWGFFSFSIVAAIVGLLLAWNAKRNRHDT